MPCAPGQTTGPSLRFIFLPLGYSFPFYFLDAFFFPLGLVTGWSLPPRIWVSQVPVGATLAHIFRFSLNIFFSRKPIRVDSCVPVLASEARASILSLLHVRIHPLPELLIVQLPTKRKNDTVPGLWRPLRLLKEVKDEKK